MKYKKLLSRCDDRELNNSQRFTIVMALLGISTIMSVIFGLLWFFGERIGTIQVLYVELLPNLSEGENWIVFIFSFISLIFFGMLLIFVIYRYILNKNCEKFEDIKNKTII